MKKQCFHILRRLISGKVTAAKTFVDNCFRELCKTDFILFPRKRALTESEGRAAAAAILREKIQSADTKSEPS